MFSVLSSRLLQRSFLMRLLQNTALSLALMTASVAAVRAEDVTVQGSPGAYGASAVNPGDLGQPGGDGESVTANASGVSPNQATAIGGDGGGGGTDFFECPPCETGGAKGGRGGDASAGATTTIISGPAVAKATSTGGGGGYGGGVDEGADQGGGDGGFATSTAAAGSGSGSATASAIANGGYGGGSDSNGGVGGDANASSTAGTSGAGDASSSANATGGAAGYSEFFSFPGVPAAGNATATADASATGGGKAIASAVATEGIPGSFPPSQPPAPLAAANATSSAETVNGAMAEATSTAGGDMGEAMSTAKTSFRGVSVQSTAMAPSTSPFIGGFGTTTVAIAQGGSGPTSGDGYPFAVSTVLPDKAFATTLIDQFGASAVADALLGPQDEIFGIAYQVVAEGSTASSTFDFRFGGDLLLGVIEGYADVTVNGAEVSIGNPGDDTVINLGSFGPNIDLTIQGEGVFAIGGAVPEPSTWAMMLLGFAGLRLAGYRQTRGDRLQAA